MITYEIDSNKLPHLNILINAFDYPERSSIVFIEVNKGGKFDLVAEFDQ
jgi:hypothetical protein